MLDIVKFVGVGFDLEFIDFLGDDKIRFMVKYDVEYKLLFYISCFWLYFVY